MQKTQQTVRSNPKPGKAKNTAPPLKQVRQRQSKPSPQLGQSQSQASFKAYPKRIPHEEMPSMGPNRKYATGSGMKGSVPDHDTTVRVPKFDQGTYRPPPGQEVVSALDRMQEAKLNPGQCSTPFVAGDNVTSLPTGVCTVANAVAECVSLNSLGELGGMYPIGGDVYTFIIQCNSMTAYHGPGGQSAAGIPYHQPDTKLGGMVIVQLAQAQMDLGFLRKDIFAQLQGGLTMAEVFRSDMEGFSDGGVVWAQETDIMEIIPEAMRACPRWKSTLIFGQLPSGDLLDGLSGNELLALSTSLAETDKPFLKTCTVNNNLVYFSQNEQRNNITVAPFAAEVVNIVCLQSPSISLTTGGPVPFTLCMTISFNFVFFADASDAVANNIFKKNTIRDANPKAHSALPHATEGVQPQDHTSVPSTKAPSFGQRMKGFFQKVGPHVWNALKQNVTREMIEGVFLMGERKTENPFYIRAELVIRLSRALRDLEALQHFPGCDAVYLALTELMKKIRTMRGRIIDIRDLTDMEIETQPNLMHPMDYIPEQMRRKPGRTILMDPGTTTRESRVPVAPLPKEPQLQEWKVVDLENRVVTQVMNPEVHLAGLRHYIGHRVSHSKNPLELSEVIHYAKLHFDQNDENKVLSLMAQARFEIPEIDHDRTLMSMLVRNVENFVFLSALHDSAKGWNVDVCSPPLDIDEEQPQQKYNNPAAARGVEQQNRTSSRTRSVSQTDGSVVAEK